MDVIAKSGVDAKGCGSRDSLNIYFICLPRRQHIGRLEINRPREPGRAAERGATGAAGCALHVIRTYRYA